MSANMDLVALQIKVSELQNALLTLHPTMPVLLREIHNHLKKDPEIVTLMTEDEIGVVVNGLKRQTTTEIVTSISKSSKGDVALKAAKKAGGSAVDLF